MGGRLTCHLNSKEHRHISEHIADILKNLPPLYQHHYCSHLLTHLMNKHMEPTEPRPLTQHTDAITHAGILLEGTLPQCLDGIWSHRHLQVTSSFSVESRHAREVFEGGWGCKTEFALSGCQIFTSIHEHCELVDNMCQHIAGKAGGKLACWDCPTAFPVFIQHPYSASVCLATASYQEQTQWANILRAATQHQSSALWREDSPESWAFLEAVSSLKKLRGKSQAKVYLLGNEEEVLVGLVMEELIPYLKKEVFPRITAHGRRGKRTIWIRLLSEVYKTAKHHVKAAMVGLKEELSLYRSDTEEQISARLQQASLLQNQIAFMMTEDMCEPMLQSLLHTIIPRLDRTLQEVAAPICNGFASTWVYFLETCEDILDMGTMSTCVKEVTAEVFLKFPLPALLSDRQLQWYDDLMLLSPLSGFRPDDPRMWKCLDRLQLSSESRVWLQDTWGVHDGTWRLLVLKAQDALYKVVDRCAVMFWRLVSRSPCFVSDSSQLTAVLCRVKDRVLKHLETELLALQSRLILDMILQIALPAFARGVNAQDLSSYNAMIDSDQAPFIHPDTIFNSILRDNLSSYIQSVMRYSLPQQFVHLPFSPNNPCSSSSGFSKSVYHKLLPHRDCQQKSSQISQGSSSKSETLTPRTMSDWEDTLANQENLEKHML